MAAMTDVTDPSSVAMESATEKIIILPGHSADLTSVTFQIQKEDHTLGNSLRYVIMKNPEVEFCGYSIPHPSEAKMNFRIQTAPSTTAVDVLRKGLDDLIDLCDAVTEKFTEQLPRDTSTTMEVDG
ncbi:DNA-directed RNA polymerase I and III subunit Rpc19 [Schizosaccharomyces pombe]|uniref:DNA-directed RNA polymerases I and III subunit RPAC2 n=1 Tax=Schizosaccharomyces pombe (strain 972 / ATCC 24843) TaxID=284812 RepID=RPAC2_SCHPO|nr:DNA-directed RNA polymerase I and III subunit Rpc19 [Schizosaccharomyces pombe]Q09177.1 RecName: Full=DNA-directed RNA polymerases I and III subunit RPAC2; Short=RNA polymerases I and III subunit AC2; AltName: Full=AC19; AltName: Full=DNA-directed RNA polymerases I and III 14 kDa polypeptide [Schizosaccharomyces pombe 972h-]7AOC_K Chain K, DNA-directed RNA polymerases I and III subunit RPAC2 [Schizosaccharomyces pombe 972h-]7AOD_K Chain K, DNA-directed RNA polymerases I and III subunit RPAC2 |eukprot:NP_593118.2 DNA-directed RNA polymerase I and III subunit Rpc19 [Schizosaccharomyces pombe]